MRASGLVLPEPHVAQRCGERGKERKLRAGELWAAKEKEDHVPCVFYPEVTQ